MILIDPELEIPAATASLDPHPAKPAAGHAATPNKTSPRKAPPNSLRMPSRRTLARFLAKAPAVARLPGEVTVLLTTDAAMRDLNRRFRGKNKPTDVLSFPSSDFVGRDQVGDLAISVETARLQAVEQGHALAVEIQVLILHGLLHLAGYDHETDAGQMQRRERSLRARLGLPQGLIERAECWPATQRGGRSGRRRKR
jgi:probable rRNA maturation factor